MVTFETGFFTRLSNQVVRIVRLRYGLDVHADFAADQPLGSELLVGQRQVAPTRNWRYSSLSVGARKPQPILPQRSRDR